MYGIALDRISVRTVALGCAAVALAYSAFAASLHSAQLFSYASAAWNTSDEVFDRTQLTLSRADLPAQAGAPLPIDDVRTQQQLVDYAQSLMHDDPRILQVEIADHSVSMTYQEQSRILRVKSIASQTRATVSDTGSVSLSKPWYASLFGTIANADAPDVGFSDLTLERDSSGLVPQSAARMLARMHGRFQIGALK